MSASFSERQIELMDKQDNGVATIEELYELRDLARKDLIDNGLIRVKLGEEK